MKINPDVDCNQVYLLKYCTYKYKCEVLYQVFIYSSHFGPVPILAMSQTRLACLSKQVKLLNIISTLIGNITVSVESI